MGIFDKLFNNEPERLRRLGSFSVLQHESFGTVRFYYTPQADITPYELAWITPMLVSAAQVGAHNDYALYIKEHGLQRHFSAATQIEKE